MKKKSLNEWEAARLKALKAAAAQMRKDGIDCKVTHTWGETMLVVRPQNSRSECA